MLQQMYDTIRVPLESLSFKFTFLNVGEVMFIALFLFFAYNRFIKGTQSEKLVKGMFILLLTWGFSEFLIKIDLEIIGVFLKTIVSIIIFSLVVVFQPELRRFLGYLGQSDFLSKFLFVSRRAESSDNVNILEEIVEAIKYLSKVKCGALIVLQKNLQDSLYSEVGTKINSDITTELILTIFHPNTPLHDGAVIIQNNRIKAAGALLPLTEDPKLSWRYGTRHRAAIGMSEVCDCACLVVSEETGDVAIAVDGILKKYDDISSLRQDLGTILGFDKSEDDSDEKSLLFNLIKIKKRQK